jgi:energy-coupling factor transport system ATP-binding protein
MRIEVSDLHFSYPDDIEALAGVSLVIEEGEQVAIIGQNGAGKTTLVKHFNGLLKPASGKVIIGEWDTSNHSVAQLATRVGYVFQNPDEQLFHRNVKDELEFGPKNLGFSPESTSERVEEAIQLAELDGYRHSNPYDLSPTWRKMVALASVIAMDTPIVIFDEPTTGQDAISVARIAKIVQKMREQGKTMIAISHDIDFCAENFDRIVAMSLGKVILDGPVHDVVGEDEILATTYVDPPQLTRLGKSLGFPQPVRDQDEFLSVFRKMKGS